MRLAYIDSSVWIARVEGLPAYRHILDETLLTLDQSGWQFCVSEAIMLEVLAKPYKHNQTELIAIYRRIFDATKRLETPADIFTQALPIIQIDQLNAMDAIHVALAVHHQCDCLVSTDKHFRTLKSLTTTWIDLQLGR